MHGKDTFLEIKLLTTKKLTIKILILIKRQLKQEGWIHHFCRNSVAIFLTRGDLFLSWERGMNTFFKYLVDADWSVCSGNWNWVSCGDPTQVIDPKNNFCPAKTGRCVDPQGIYIR